MFPYLYPTSFLPGPLVRDFFISAPPEQDTRGNFYFLPSHGTRFFLAPAQGKYGYTRTPQLRSLIDNVRTAHSEMLQTVR